MKTNSPIIVIEIRGNSHPRIAPGATPDTDPWSPLLSGVYGFHMASVKVQPDTGGRKKPA
tara:strand:- start:3784 stop:3963 length:180 start_codon:yes stop_codon:yes gene_type:complete